MMHHRQRDICQMRGHQKEASTDHRSPKLPRFSLDTPVRLARFILTHGSSFLHLSTGMTENQEKWVLRCWCGMRLREYGDMGWATASHLTLLLNLWCCTSYTMDTVAWSWGGGFLCCLPTIIRIMRRIQRLFGWGQTRGERKRLFGSREREGQFETCNPGNTRKSRESYQKQDQIQDFIYLHALTSHPQPKQILLWPV